MGNAIVLMFQRGYLAIIPAILALGLVMFGAFLGQFL